MALANRNVTKIVAFGGATFVFGSKSESQGVTRMHVQHAALLIFREVWHETHKGHLLIFLQDPHYLAADVKIAEHYEMTIVNCSVGHQLGWSLVDDETFVVDLRMCGMYLKAFVLEYSRPAVIFSPFRPDIEFNFLTPALAPYAYTLKHKGESILLPGPGP